MEFHEKLQALRRQRGLTQEELAAELFVSRTAISKLESGRGYPSIDSLKAISAYFKVSIDDLLSGAEVLTIAQEDASKMRNVMLVSMCLWVFFDISVGAYTNIVTHASTIVSIITAKMRLDKQ